jgi:hypothetical protein
MARLFNEAEHLAEVGAPVSEDLVACLLTAKVDDPRGSVDPGPNGLVHDELAENLLRPWLGKIEELRESGEGDAGVVGGDNADVLFMEQGGTVRATREKVIEMEFKR